MSLIPTLVDPDYKQLDYVEVAAATTPTTITLSAINQSYRHLRLIMRTRITTARTSGFLRPNNDSTSSNYAASGNATSILCNYLNGNNSTANTYSIFEMMISNYSSTTTSKEFLGRDFNINVAAADFQNAGGIYLPSTAITSLVLSGGTFEPGSSMTLYGLK